MRAIAVVAAGAPMFLGASLMVVGCLLAFPLVISILLGPIGFRPTSWAAGVFVGGLILEVLGFGSILIGARIRHRFAQTVKAGSDQRPTRRARW